MMNYIWGILILISILFATVTGRLREVSDAVLTGSSDAISLVISMCGMMCLWTGLMKIADQAGLTSMLAKLFAGVLRRLFPEYKKDSPAARAICMNITANLLGLGNAATPLGIAAMKEMQKTNKDPTTANNSMAMFVVINTASLQLIPTLLSTLRQKHHSSAPFEILPAIWITSIAALSVGILSAKLFERKGKRHG